LRRAGAGLSRPALPHGRGAAPRAGPRRQRDVPPLRDPPRRGGGHLDPPGPGRPADAGPDPAATGERGPARPLREALRRLPGHLPLIPHRAVPGRRGGMTPMDRPSYGYSAEDTPGPQSTPVCPRHPDRVSYVRCKRCDRPACPECQRPTSVGVLCVDCDRELAQQQASTRPRNALGGGIGRRTPYVTYTVIALCVLAYVGQMLAPQVVQQLGVFAPFRALYMPWTFFTAGFLHGGIIH